jgi:plexin D
LAAVNRLYQLSSANLSLEAEATVGPVPDSPLCHAPQLPQASCEHPRRLTDNYNKILQLDPGQGLVVACGSIYQGLCQLRRRGNISALAVSFPPAAPTAEPVTVFPSMLNVAANHPNASTVGLVLPPTSGTGGSRLLVGATYTGFGSAFFPRNRSLEDHRFENTPEIAIRSLDARGDLAKLFTFDLNPSDDNILKIKQGAKEQHKLGFVRAFLHPAVPPHSAQPYAYLALNSEARAGDKDSQARSLLARICLPRGAGGDAKKLTESYIQLGLQCAGGAGRGDLYSRLVSVFPAREQFFAVFERPQGAPGARNAPAALCAFRFDDVQAAIRAARTACFVEPAPDVVAVLDSVVQGTGPACESKRNIQVSHRPEGRVRGYSMHADIPEDWLLPAVLARERTGSQVRTPKWGGLGCQGTQVFPEDSAPTNQLCRWGPQVCAELREGSDTRRVFRESAGALRTYLCTLADV